MNDYHWHLKVFVSHLSGAQYALDNAIHAWRRRTLGPIAYTLDEMLVEKARLADQIASLEKMLSQKGE